jgi:hypothetical protein
VRRFNHDRAAAAGVLSTMSRTSTPAFCFRGDGGAHWFSVTMRIVFFFTVVDMY